MTIARPPYPYRKNALPTLARPTDNYSPGKLITICCDNISRKFSAPQHFLVQYLLSFYSLYLFKVEGL